MKFPLISVQELANLWAGLVLINGRPRHPQSQGSVERSNGTMKKKLNSWLRDNNTQNWTRGLMFVQWSMNTTFSEATKVIPYTTLFGTKPRTGLRTNLTTEFLKNIPAGMLEEEFEQLFSKNSPSPSTENPTHVDEDITSSTHELSKSSERYKSLFYVTFLLYP